MLQQRVVYVLAVRGPHLANFPPLPSRSGLSFDLSRCYKFGLLLKDGNAKFVNHHLVPAT